MSRQTITLVCESGRMGGRPTIGDSRLPVSTILAEIRAGMSDAKILSEWPDIIGGLEAIAVLRGVVLDEDPTLREQLNSQQDAINDLVSRIEILEGMIVP
jgi:hypothetical protein